MLWPVLAIATTSCAGFGTTASSESACPPVVGYDQATRHRAANELLLLPADSAVATMLADYLVLRRMSRACSDAYR